ncbi:MAG: SBBP repeat-containing protein, partial [Pirellulales bacterium]
MPDGRVPFRWTAETGAQIIAPVLVTQAFFPERDAGPFVSDDGSVVYANLSTPNPIGYRWAADTGWARLDFTLQVNPSGISADGNLIAGSIGSAANREVALWDARHGVRPLRDILVEDYGLGEGLAGWGRLSSLAGISADGSVVAGRGFNPDGVQEAWIAYLGPATVPEPTTIWLAALGLAAAGVIHGARRRFKKQPAKRLSIEPLEDRNFLAADPVLPEWMVTVGSPTGTDLSVRAAAHPSGDVYMTARFNGTVDFDPGPGTAPLTSLGDTDVALARYSPAGVLVWARRIGGGVGADFDRALAIDRLGNAYLAGEFTAFVGPQGQQMPGSIVVKIDNSGNAVWAQSVPTGMAAYEDSLRGLSVDDGDANAANWSVFLVGHFKGTANFGGQTLRSTAGSVDGFVSKLATSSGTYLWTNAIAGSGNQSAIGIDVAKTGGAGLYVSASGATEARFGTTTLGAGHFLAKYDPANGSLVWAKQVANFGEVATDGFNVYVGGTGAGNAAVHAFSSSGDLVWSRPLTGSNAIESMAVSPAGNLYVTGDINTTATFGGHTLTPTGTDGYLAQLDSLGSVISAYVIPDQGEGIAVDANDNVYVSGGFGGPTFHHFPTGDSVRATSGFLDIALLKFSPSAPPIDPTPAIVLFDASPDAVLAGESVTLRVNRVHDPDLRLQSMNFYRDTGSGI